MKQDVFSGPRLVNIVMFNFSSFKKICLLFSEQSQTAKVVGYDVPIIHSGQMREHLSTLLLGDSWNNGNYGLN